MVLKLPCIACAPIVPAQHVRALTKSLLIPTATAHTAQLQLLWRIWRQLGTSSWTKTTMSREATARIFSTRRGVSSTSFYRGTRGCFYHFSSSSCHALRTNCTSGTSLYCGYIQFIYYETSLYCGYIQFIHSCTRLLVYIVDIYSIYLTYPSLIGIWGCLATTLCLLSFTNTPRPSPATPLSGCGQ